MDNHTKLMKRALKLAKRAEGRTSPNPMVGAVIVKDGEIVGEGFHAAAGQAHAEVEAISAAGDRCKGAVMYVTLEPCCHHGRTPPCTDAVIKAGISEVFYAVSDPNPYVSGQGHQRLEHAGIKVHLGPCEAEAAFLNRAFFHFIKTGLPWVTAKYAMSLDGKIATVTNESQWITGPEARKMVHQLRNISDTILIGVDTVRVDDPRLTTRLQGRKCHHPIRVVLDSRGRIPLDAKILDPKLPAKTIIAGTAATPHRHRDALAEMGVELMLFPRIARGRVDLGEMIKELGKRKYMTLMVEGGSDVLGGMLLGKHLNEVWTFIGNKMIGGDFAPSPFGGPGIEYLDEAERTEVFSVENIGQDVLIKSLIRQ